ncbi:hypothetical protein OTSUT76_1071 [Orientia tsutsugamushi str. UT76]|nr:hypothetical protein OTSUT76_1071 [Orientia tsutsugamushi str. UT76]
MPAILTAVLPDFNVVLKYLELMTPCLAKSDSYGAIGLQVRNDPILQILS